jgi:hypothetical protein
MIMIRTAEDFARLLSAPPHPSLQPILQMHAERLADYDLEDVAEVVIVQVGDTIDAIEHLCPFASPVELIAEHDHYFELTWILSDDGFGMVLFVPTDESTDPLLLRLCRSFLIDFQAHEQTGPGS